MTVSRRQVDHIHVVQIERPEHRNAVDAATARQLADAFREFNADERSDVTLPTDGSGEVLAVVEDQQEVASPQVAFEKAERRG